MRTGHRQAFVLAASVTLATCVTVASTNGLILSYEVPGVPISVAWLACISAGDKYNTPHYQGPGNSQNNGQGSKTCYIVHPTGEDEP